MTATTKIRAQLVFLWGRLPAAWQAAMGGYSLARILFTLWSVAILNLFPIAVQNITLNGEPLLTIFDLHSSRSYVYDRTVNDETLTFETINNARLRDRQTGSLWDFASGQAMDGPLQGIKLSIAETSPEKIFPYMGVRAPQRPLLAIWQHFDANWYLAIAQKGYGQFPDDTHFGPLYPALVWVAHLIIGDWLVAGLIVSNLAVLFLLKTFYEMAAAWGDDRVALNSLFLFLIFPSAFFLFSAYAEPLFILTAMLALRDLQARRWLLGGIWIAGAILARVQGVALLLPLASALWQEYGLRIKPAHFKAALFPALAIVGYIALRILSGAPSAIPINEPSVAARLVWPWNNFFDAIAMIATGSATYITVVNLVLTVLFIGLLIFGWKKIPLEYSLYWLACMAILVSREVESEPLNPMIRYALTIFPAFMVTAKFGDRPWVNRLVVISAFVLGLFMSAQFFMWGFIA